MHFRRFEGLGREGILRVLEVSLLLLVASPMVISSFGQAAVANASGTTGCTNLALEKLMATTPVQMGQQSAISDAQASAQYGAITASAQSVNFSSLARLWTFSLMTCTVSLEDLAVNFHMRADNGSRYIVIVDVNPNSGAIDRTTVEDWFLASPINVGSGTAYSGYGICASSSCNLGLLETTAQFYQPTVSQPSGTYLGVQEPDCHTPNGYCKLAVWTGLATCDYTGLPTSCSYSTSKVVQAGTFATVKCSPTCSISYTDFYENFPYGPGGCGQPLYASDQIVASVENQYIVTGISGNSWYTYVTDYTQSWSCAPSPIGYPNSSYTPVYADYIVERPQNGSSTCNTANCQFTLPDFSTVTFSYCQLTYTSSNGAYTYYNAGDGFGVQMQNSYKGTNYQDTTTAAMTSSNYGTFTVGYDDSIGT